MNKAISLGICLLMIAMLFIGCGSETPTSQTPETGSGALSGDATAPDNSVNSLDMSSAKKMEDAADVSSAVPVNSWLQTTNYSSSDKTHHTSYGRVVKVVTSSDDSDYVQQCITTHNDYVKSIKKGSLIEGDMDFAMDLEYCVLEYELYVPNDFPIGDDGIGAPRPFFSIKVLDDQSAISSEVELQYVNGGQCSALFSDEASPSTKYLAGNTYLFRYYFLMKTGHTNYVFHTSFIPEGGGISDQAIWCNFSSH